MCRGCRCWPAHGSTEAFRYRDAPARRPGPWRPPRQVLDAHDPLTVLAASAQGQRELVSELGRRQWPPGSVAKVPVNGSSVLTVREAAGTISPSDSIR